VWNDPAASFFVRSLIIWMNDLVVVTLIFGNLMCSIHYSVDPHEMLSPEDSVRMQRAVPHYSDTGRGGLRHKPKNGSPLSSNSPKQEAKAALSSSSSDSEDENEQRVLVESLPPARDLPFSVSSLSLDSSFPSSPRHTKTVSWGVVSCAENLEDIEHLEPVESEEEKMNGCSARRFSTEGKPHGPPSRPQRPLVSVATISETIVSEVEDMDDAGTMNSVDERVGCQKRFSADDLVSSTPPLRPKKKPVSELCLCDDSTLSSTSELSTNSKAIVQQGQELAHQIGTWMSIKRGIQPAPDLVGSSKKKSS